jgi:hypothetical protein
MLMQATLVLILAATVGLAELVTRGRNQSGVPALNQSRQIDQVLVKLPADWDLNEDDPDVVMATEPRADGRGRTLMVRVLKISGARSADEFLRRSGLLNGTMVIRNGQESEPDDAIAMEVAPVKTRQIPMAGQMGVMTHVLRPGQMTPDTQPSLHSETIAVALLPSKTAIVAQLDSTEPDVDGDDRALLEKIAAAIQVTGEKQP